MKRWLILLAAFPLLASAAAERIVSLGGDVTEVVYALDAQRQLVGKDSTSTWPAAAQSLPVRPRHASTPTSCPAATGWPARRLPALAHDPHPLIVHEQHIEKARSFNCVSLMLQPAAPALLLANLQAIAEQPPHALIIQGFGTGNLAVNDAIIEL